MLVVFLNFVIQKKKNYVHKREKEKTIKIEIRVNYTLPPSTITHFSLHPLNFKKYQLTP